MNWSIQYIDEAEEDFRNLSGNQRIVVAKALKKISTHPQSILLGVMVNPLEMLKNQSYLAF
jgi:mRNA interferase RelE/StbE